jgi:hypothetical protein
VGERKLKIVTDEDRHEIAELRREFQDFRDEVRMWQAVTCGVVAGFCLILGALAMSYK